MIKFLKRLIFGRVREFHIGQVVILNKPYAYLGWFPVNFELVPRYWVITEVLDVSSPYEYRHRITITLAPILEAHQLSLIKRSYFPQYIHVEPKHIDAAPDFIQILYGSKNGQK